MAQQPPDHWKLHVGPCGWFRVWHPPSWQVDTVEGVTHLILPDQAGILSLRCSWSDLTSAEKTIDLNKLFPRRRHVASLRPLSLPERSIGWQGEAVMEPRMPWWKRLLRRTVWHRWKVWMVEWPSLEMLATFIERGDRPKDPESETLVRMVLNTMWSPDIIADPPHVFAARALNLARQKFPLLECESRGDFQLQLGKSNINLFNFYRSYVQSPDRFESILLPALTTVVQVQEWGEEQTTPTLELVRQRIMPMLYPESVWRQNFPNFVGEPWVGNLMVLYVVDEAQAYWYIRKDLLKKWELTADELHEIAMENLERYFDENPTEVVWNGKDDEPKLVVPHKPDAYNTSRLLSSAFHEQLRDILGGEIAIGMPNRDFFVAVSLDAPEMVAYVRERVREDFTQMDHPLTDKLLLVSADGVSELG